MPTPPPAPGADARKAEMRILLIEDSLLLQKRLTEMLQYPGVMRVTGTAATEREARERIDSGDYDVLLVDVQLRDGSGIGAIGHARRRYSARQPLIIVLTNYPLAVVRSRCLAAGADHFLDKMRQLGEVQPLISAAQRPLA
jgi:CheY-like chemotaxis protein